MRRAAPAFLLAAVFAAPLCAQFVPDGKWWKRPRIAAAIDLTVEQERQLDQIFVRTRPKLIDLKADVEKREFEFQQAMEEGADRKVIASRIEAREEARARLQKELTLMVVDMRQVLRHEQWERLTRMQQTVRERMKQRRQQLRDEQRRLEQRQPLDEAAPSRPAVPSPTRRQPR